MKKVLTEEQKLKRNQAVKNWKIRNPEKWKEIAKRTRIKNAEKIKIQQRLKYLRWKIEKPERLKEITKKSYQKYRFLKRWNTPENKEKNRLRGKKWREKNKGETTKRVREWRKNNPEESKENRRKWARENPEKNRISHKNNETKRRKAEGKFTLKEWQDKKKEFNYTCPACFKKEPEIKLSIDHIIPLVKGGSNYIENIQPLCMPCNSRKNNKFIKYKPILI